MTKNIAAITTVRNDAMFLPKWIDHYGKAFGYRNLYVILDGHDQSKPICEGSEKVNFLYLPFTPIELVPAMKRRARVMSKFAAGLFQYFDIVLATDVDEFLIVDPNVGKSLSDYLSGLNKGHQFQVSG